MFVISLLCSEGMPAQPASLSTATVSSVVSVGVCSFCSVLFAEHLNNFRQPVVRQSCSSPPLFPFPSSWSFNLAVTTILSPRLLPLVGFVSRAHKHETARPEQNCVYARYLLTSETQCVVCDVKRFSRRNFVGLLHFECERPKTHATRTILRRMLCSLREGSEFEMVLHVRTKQTQRSHPRSLTNELNKGIMGICGTKHRLPVPDHRPARCSSSVSCSREDVCAAQSSQTRCPDIRIPCRSGEGFCVETRFCFRKADSSLTQIKIAVRSGSRHMEITRDKHKTRHDSPPNRREAPLHRNRSPRAD